MVQLLAGGNCCVHCCQIKPIKQVTFMCPPGGVTGHFGHAGTSVLPHQNDLSIFMRLLMLYLGLNQRM